MKHVEEFDNFIRNEVNLDKNRYSLLQERVRVVAEYLSQDLDSFEKRENQGSYALGTVIKPTNGRDYDSDVLIYMKDDSRRGPSDYLNELYVCLGTHPDRGMYFIWNLTQLNVRPYSRAGLLRYKIAPGYPLSGPFNHSGVSRGPEVAGPVRSYNLVFTYPCQGDPPPLLR